MANAIESQIQSGAFTSAKGRWLARKNDARELWVRIFPDDFFVHSHETALLPTELDAGRAYWIEIWETEHEFRQVASPATEQAQAKRQDRQSQAWTHVQETFKAARAKWIIHTTQPENFLSAQTDYAQAPIFPDIALKAAPWTQAPHTRVLPDRFVVRLYSGDIYREYQGNPVDHSLVLGLDPQQDEFSTAEDVLELPEKLRWLNEFETAEQMGMGIRIPLSDKEFMEGFDQLLVLGLRLSSDQQQSQELLEELFLNHQHKFEGCAFLPQGTPTNNIAKHRGDEQEEEQERTAYRRWGASLISASENEAAHRPDGEYLAKALGLNVDLFQRMLHSDQLDIHEAIAFNQVLWPATMGYFLRQFLSPLLDEDTLKQTHEFFAQFVTGRGLTPCFRVGNQPYGIVPTTALSRWDYPSGVSEHDFARALFHRVLKPLDSQWHRLVPNVIHAGDSLIQGEQFSDRLVQLLGLHAASVEFYVRTLVDPFFADAVMPVQLVQQMDDQYWQVMNGLKDMGVSFGPFESATRIFDMMYSQDVRSLNGPLIDGLPFSETRTVKKFPDSEQHYLDWLVQADLLQELKPETLPLQPNDGLPLLYLLLRHAVTRTYINTAIALLKQAGLVSPVTDMDQEREEHGALGENHKYVLQTAIQLKWQHSVLDKLRRLYQQLLDEGSGDAAAITRFEQAVVNAFDCFKATNYIAETVQEAVKKLRQRVIPEPASDHLEITMLDFVKDVEEAIQAAVDSEFQAITTTLATVEPNKWNLLSQRFEQVTGTKTILEFINDQLQASDSTEAVQDLAKMHAALSVIKDLPTARLERVLVEHLDLCNYRLDTWILGLLHQRLAQQRTRNPHGIFLGAFGYLEDLRPSHLPGLMVQEVTEPELVNWNEVTSSLDDIKVPVLDVTALDAEGHDVEQILKHGFVYLGSEPDTGLRGDPHSHRIIPQPRVDDTGEGFLHAPSLIHANAAAILRAGYATYNATDPDPTATDPLAINLSSRRVREALYYLDGIRQGQELGALLGYQFERALHAYAEKTPLDTGFVSRVAGYLLELRRRFPIETQSQDDGDEGDNMVFTVVDGRALLNTFQQHTGKTHWSTGILNDCLSAHRAILDQELRRLEETLDALSDLLMAESVYQMAQGNAERSAAALRALNDGGTIDKPEVVATPQRGFIYWQRVGLAMDGSPTSPMA